jgi:hypothetical protein
MSNKGYIPADPRFDTKHIDERHQHWARSLTEPFSEQEQITLQWLYDNSPVEQRKYVIINDKLVLAPRNSIVYQLKQSYGHFGWHRITPKN